MPTTTDSTMAPTILGSCCSGPGGTPENVELDESWRNAGEKCEKRCQKCLRRKSERCSPVMSCCYSVMLLAHSLHQEHMRVATQSQQGHNSPTKHQGIAFVRRTSSASKRNVLIHNPFSLAISFHQFHSQLVSKNT